MGTTNPIFRYADIVVTGESSREPPLARNGAELRGVFLKASLLLAEFLASAVWGWVWLRATVARGSATSKMGLFVVVVASAVGALALIFLTVRKKRWAPLTGPVYALVQGVGIGAGSAGLDIRFPGAAIQAVSVTAVMCFALLVGYRTGAITLSDSYRKRFCTAIGAAVLLYALNFVIGSLGMKSFPVAGAGVPALVAIAAIIVFAAQSLLADFDAAAQLGGGLLPPYMEWYVALGLLVTLVFLYADIMRLATKARSSAGAPAGPA